MQDLTENIVQEIIVILNKNHKKIVDACISHKIWLNIHGKMTAPHLFLLDLHFSVNLYNR